MRPNESEAEYKRRVDRVSAANMVRIYLDGQAEYMHQIKIDHCGPVAAKYSRNLYRRLAAKWMVKAWLLR